MDSIKFCDADHLAIKKDTQKLLNDGLSKLPARCREIFELSRKEYLSTKEIALQLGIAPKTVENQLTIALRHLRFILSLISLLIFIS